MYTILTCKYGKNQPTQSTITVKPSLQEACALLEDLKQAAEQLYQPIDTAVLFAVVESHSQVHAGRIHKVHTCGTLDFQEDPEKMFLELTWQVSCLQRKGLQA